MKLDLEKKFQEKEVLAFKICARKNLTGTFALELIAKLSSENQH